MPQPIVELNGVCLTYHTLDGETKALSKLSFTVDRGEFIAIVGPSGCGKTSVLSLLSGLMKPTHGSIYVADSSPGYMLQHDHLLSWRTIKDNVTLGLRVRKMLTKQTRDYAYSLIDKYGLHDFAHSYPHQLSGGMRQKTALIRTLALSPELLLLDEPFSSLDYQTRLALSDEVHRIIKDEEKTAILVTHDISEALSMSDRILIFSDRPARLKHELKLENWQGLSTIERRSMPDFKNRFELIWKELKHDAQQ